MRDRGYIQPLRRIGGEERYRALRIVEDDLVVWHVRDGRATVVRCTALQVVVSVIEILVEHLLVCEDPVVVDDRIGLSDEGAPLVRVRILDVLPDDVGAYFWMLVEPAVEHLTVRRHGPNTASRLPVERFGILLLPLDPPGS